MDEKGHSKHNSTETTRVNEKPHDHERAEANWQRTICKTKALGFFARHISDKTRQRFLLTQFMHRMKNQKVIDKPELDAAKEEYEHAETASNINTLRPKSPELPSKPIPSPEVRTWKPFEVLPGCKCKLCSVVFPVFHEHEAIPCRVCNEVFHKHCLEKCGDLTISDTINIKKATSNVGWSCPECANISLLLSTDEVKQMSYEFERLDLNQDGQISLTEYLRYHSRRTSLTDSKGVLDSAEKERLIKVFEFLDQNGDNMLDWWEFVNHESKLFLAKKDKNDLLHMLTEKEVIAAKATFVTLDQDGDGKIKEYEAIQSFKKWFRQFDKLRIGTSGEENDIFKDSDSLDLLATVASRSIMEADSSKEGVVQWNDFILDQALYIICGRPNMNADKFRL